MDLTLTMCTDERKKVNKTFTTVSTYTNVKPITPIDILNPTIKISGNITGGNSFIYNGRNYFITARVCDNGSTYITGTCDAISSWKNNIYGSTQFVTKSETNNNTQLNDNLVLTNKPTVKIINTGLTLFGNGLGTDKCYIIGVK